MHGTRATARPAFSLLELVIVIVIIGILAAIAIPRMGGGAENAKAQALQASLEEIRSRIEVYKAEHQGSIPGLQFVAQMTLYTDDQGKTSDKPSPQFPYGPYLLVIPKNPYSGMNTVRFLMFAGQASVARATDGGWTYNVVTGEFDADCSDARVDAKGVSLNSL